MIIITMDDKTDLYKRKQELEHNLQKLEDEIFDTEKELQDVNEKIFYSKIPDEFKKLLDKIREVKNRKTHIAKGLEAVMQEWALISYNLDLNFDKIVILHQYSIFGGYWIYFIKTKDKNIYKIKFSDWKSEKYNLASCVLAKDLDNIECRDFLVNFYYEIKNIFKK